MQYAERTREGAARVRCAIGYAVKVLRGKTSLFAHVCILKFCTLMRKHIMIIEHAYKCHEAHKS